MRIVLVGYGPVGARFVEELLPAVTSGDVALTVVGAEREDAYNRVLVAEYAVGAADRARLDVTDTAAARAAGVRIDLGAAAVELDRTRQTVLLDSGERLDYDRLVLATGARPNIPTLVGLGDVRHDRRRVPTAAADVDRGTDPFPLGVVAMRDLEDADQVRATVRSGGTVVVLGAGVLGMEFALLAAEHGTEVVVVHQGPAPMARNLDRDGGRVLARVTRAAGVGLAANARAEAIETVDGPDGRPRFSALLGADGSRIPGDLLVLSCGVAARTELAERAGIATDRGVLVDEELRSWTDPSVHAIGDCAHVVDPDAPVSGGPAGLIGPGWRQASRLADRLTREARATAAPLLPTDDGPVERPAVVMLKATGVDLVAGGLVDVDPWRDDDVRVGVWLDPVGGQYCKTVVRGDVLVGFVTVGMPRAGAELTLLFERGSSVPGDPATLLRLDAPTAARVAPRALDADATVCACNGVSAGTVTAAAGAGADTIEAVGAATRAGTGCGGCRGRIEELLTASGIVRVG
ncbi:NAD(P)/FAD-dependent oxidoreductase [Curtobacterium sp. ISL-83]|nr:NAD(P)/FAD-dependent oxidoreductase [Curtobacterium sp. ISL-83]